MTYATGQSAQFGSIQGMVQHPGFLLRQAFSRTQSWCIGAFIFSGLLEWSFSLRFEEVLKVCEINIQIHSCNNYVSIMTGSVGPHELWKSHSLASDLQIKQVRYCGRTPAVRMRGRLQLALNIWAILRSLGRQTEIIDVTKSKSTFWQNGGLGLDRRWKACGKDLVENLVWLCWVFNFTWHTSTCSVRERGQQVQMSLDSPLSTALQTPWFPQQSLVFAWKFAWTHSGSTKTSVCCTCYSLFDWIVSSALVLMYTSPEPAYFHVGWSSSFQRKPLPERLVRLGHCMLVPALGSSKQDDELATPLKGEVGKWKFVKYKVYQSVFGNFTVYRLLF